MVGRSRLWQVQRNEQTRGQQVQHEPGHHVEDEQVMLVQPPEAGADQRSFAVDNQRSAVSAAPRKKERRRGEDVRGVAPPRPVQGASEALLVLQRGGSVIATEGPL